MHYDRFTRLLHIFLALGMTAQLGMSLIMVHPKPGRAANVFYEIHEVLGLVLLGILALHWIWIMVRGGRVPPAQLFPWLSPARYGSLVEDTKRYASHMVRFRLPESTEPSPLPGAIQGLGLTVAGLMALSGLVMFVSSGPMTGWLHTVKEVHEVMGNIMWVYLGLHGGMGVLHQLAGHGSISAMLQIRRSAPGP